MMKKKLWIKMEVAYLQRRANIESLRGCKSLYSHLLKIGIIQFMIRKSTMKKRQIQKKNYDYCCLRYSIFDEEMKENNTIIFFRGTAYLQLTVVLISFWYEIQGVKKNKFIILNFYNYFPIIVSKITTHSNA